MNNCVLIHNFTGLDEIEKVKIHCLTSFLY